MSATLRTLPFLAKLVLVAGLLCGVFSAQPGYAQPVAAFCAMPASVRAQPAAVAMSCQHCCVDKPCCLVSTKTAETVPRPEPLSSERSQHGHASLAVTLTLVPAFEFLAPPIRFRVSTRELAVHPARTRAPREAVSCIWLI